MIIIVEGSNRVGKTTLINEIRKQKENLFVINRRPMKNIQNKKYVHNIIDIVTLDMIRSIKLENPKNIIVLDRFHLSEIVYGIVDRHYYNREEWFLEEELNDMNARLVFLHSNYNHIESQIAKARYEQIQDVFKFQFSRSKLHNKFSYSLDGIMGDMNDLEIQKIIGEVFK